MESINEQEPSALRRRLIRSEHDRDVEHLVPSKDKPSAEPIREFPLIEEVEHVHNWSNYVLDEEVSMHKLAVKSWDSWGVFFTIYCREMKRCTLK